VEGGCGALTENGGVFPGKEAGDTDSKGAREKGELMSYS
jgi:hypothetical protein